MPTIVVKVLPNVGYYVLWSTVVDNMVGGGTKESIQDRYGRDEYSDDRFDRADKNGSSARYSRDGPDCAFGWNEKTFLVTNTTFRKDASFFRLSRDKLFDYAQLPTEEAEKLLTPIDLE